MNCFDLIAQSNYGQLSQQTLMTIYAVVIVFYFFLSFCIMKIAGKTGTDGAWMAFIPLLQLVLILRIGDKPVWYVILFFIPIVNLILSVMIWVWVAEALGRSPVWAALASISGIGMLFLLPSYAFGD